MLRVLHVSQQFPSDEYPSLGIMVKHSVCALSALPAHVEQEVLAPRPYTLPVRGFPYGKLARLPTRQLESGVMVHRPHYLYLVPKRLLYPHVGPAMRFAVSRYASRLQVPDVIHAHWAYPDGWAALSLRKRFKRPLVIHARGTLERVIAQQSPRFRELVATPLTAADAVIANSHALHDDCLALGVQARKLHVIPNGVDLSLFTPADKAAAKRALGFSDRRMLVLYCGNLRLVKGVDLLAAALPKVCALRPQLDVVFVGSGELTARLQRELAALLIAGRVSMKGALPQSEVARYMQAADLLVLPSRSEARGNVVLEAMSCQTPVAAARVGGIPEIMRSEYGALFEPESVPAIVQALVGMTADPVKLAQQGVAAERFARNSGLTWRAHAEHTLELYRWLGDSARNSRPELNSLLGAW